MSDFNSPASGKPRKLKVLISLALVALMLVGLAYFNRSSVRAFIDNFSDVEYSGTGTGNIRFTIAPGEIGTTIAKQLAELGVTKDYNSTLRHIVSANPIFYPGTYSLPLMISSDRAIQLLTDNKNQVTNTVTIPEGLRLDQIYKRLSTATGIKVAAFRAAAKDPRSFGLPKAAPSVEGYLFPATYSFDPNLKAVDILKMMIDRMKDELARYGVAKKDWHKTLTLASVVQREARLHDDFYKVARVFRNRLAIDMPLQSCATASYGVGSFSIIVTNKILNDDNPYNTYKYAGLPLGPIAAPGSLAIDATLHPADGSWLYFVTWNLQSGETIFSDTYSQHLAGVAKWDKWMAENPGWDE